VPATEVIFYRERTGRAPVADWLIVLKQKDERGFAKCVARLRRLAQAGHALRRPEAAPLRAGIYELRTRSGRVHHRLLYFFHGTHAVLAHALSKEKAIPAADMRRALGRKASFEADPETHTYEGMVDDGEEED
jgi:phage-related protein